MSEPTRARGPGDGHYITLLAISLQSDGESATGSIPVRSQLFAPGTTRIRTGLLATAVDLIAGHCPDGAVGPTVDLRLQMLARPPSSGRVHLTSRPLKVGARFIVGETLLTDDADRPFGRAVHSFLNNSMGEGITGPLVPPAMAETSFDEFLGARATGERRLELDPDPRLTIPGGTVQGGAQALLAELAAEHALGGGRRLVASDLDIRFLGRVKVGPVVAAVTHAPIHEGPLTAVVSLWDAGNENAAVASVTLTLESAPVSDRS